MLREKGGWGTDHVAVAIERLDAAQQLLVVPHVDQQKKQTGARGGPADDDRGYQLMN